MFNEDISTTNLDYESENSGTGGARGRARNRRGARWSVAGSGTRF